MLRSVFCFLVFISLFSVYRCQYFDVIRSTQEIHQFHSVILILPEGGASSEILNDINSKLLHTLKTPFMILTNFRSFVTPYSRIILSNANVVVKVIFQNRNNLFIVFFEREHQNFMAMLEPILYEMRYTQVIVVLTYTLEDTTHELTNFFESCWAKKILRVIVLFSDKYNSNQVFGYNPFLKTRLENKTTFSTEELLTNDNLRNLHGYPIRTPIKLDEPRVFRYHDRHGKELLGGYGSKVFVEFLKKHNAKLQEVFISNATYLEGNKVVTLVNRGVVDIPIHPFGVVSNIATFSYPMLLIDLCVMIPVAQEVQRFMYTILPFDALVWSLVFASVLILILVELVVIRLLNKKFDLSRAYSDIVGTIVSQFCVKKNNLKNWYYRFIYLNIVLFGFILTSSYSTHLTSFFTTKIYEAQIDTMDQMIAAKSKLMGIDYEVVWYIEQLNVKKLMSLFVKVSPDTFNSHRNKLNTSYGYTVPLDTARIILQQQKHYQKPKFWLTSTCILPTPLAYILSYDSPFKDIFDYFIMQTIQFGLLYKWIDDTFDEGVQSGIFDKTVIVEESKKQLTLAHLTIPYVLLGVGLCISTVCFLIENMIKHSSRG